MRKKYNINGVWLNTKELSNYIGISRQWLYTIKDKMPIEEIIKNYKNNELTPTEAKNIKNTNKKNYEELLYLKIKIKDLNFLIDNLMKKYNNEGVSMLDLQQIKEKLK